MKLTLTIDIPDGQVAEFARLVASHLADSGHEAARPRRDPGGVGPAPGDPTESGRSDRSRADLPADGRQLLGWLRQQPDRNLHRRAVDLAKSRGYGTLLVKLGPDQAADLYHELTAGRPRAKWGGG